MRSHVVVVAALVSGLVLTGCGSDATAEGCTTTVELGAVIYTPSAVGTDVPAASQLGTAVERGCGDDGAYERPVALTEIPGIDPGTAVGSPAAARIVYLAPDVSLDDLPAPYGDD